MRLLLAVILLLAAFPANAQDATIGDAAGAAPQRPETKVPFPELRRRGTLKITLTRAACPGPCPVYTVEIDGDGSVTYDGQAFVAVPGRHRTRIAQDSVRALFETFRQADFFWLLDAYRAPVTDLPTTTVGIAFDNVQKRVVDYAGDRAGMPPQATALEHQIDLVAGTEKWVAGNAETLPALQAEGWDFHSHHEDNLRLLGLAGTSYNPGLITQWLKAGVPADSGYGCVALNAAVTHHDMATAQLLAAVAAPFVAETGKSYSGQRCDALGDAAERDDIAGAIWLMDHGADVDQHDRQGTTLLMRAGHFVDIYTLLLSRGADFNAHDAKGQTVLMQDAAWPDLVRLLLKAGANPDLKDMQGKTALDFYAPGSPAAQVLTDWRREHGK